MDAKAADRMRGRMVLMLAVRFLVVTALLGSSLFFDIRSGKELSSSQWLLYYVVAGFYVMTLAYGLWLRFGRTTEGVLERNLQVQVLLDVGLATFLVYLTGGVESPFSFFYALPIINSAISFTRQRAMWTAGLSCLMLGALFVMENQGILPVNLVGRVNAEPDATRVVYLLALNDSVFFAIAWLAGTLGEQLRRTGRELKATEEDLSALMALTRDIVTSLRSGLMALDEEGHVSLLNPMAEEIIGCRARDALDRPGLDVFPSLEPLLDAREGGSRQVLNRAEVMHPREVENPLPVGLTLSPLYNADGTVGTLVHMQDLTELKTMQASVQRAERLASLGRMAAGLAHEIRNPLASISGSVQMLRRGPEEQAIDPRLMDIILRETERLDKLLGDFLAYARPRPLRLVATRVDLIVSETVEMFRSGLDGQDLALELDLAEAKVALDQDQFRQVVWNLLTNAAESLGQGGRIWIRVAREGEGVVVVVADDGPGVPEEIAEHIFEPFFTSKDLGTGLGLASVSQIAEAHGGVVELGRSEAGGAEFILRLPGS
ncbi:MAG: PAS domain-containing protein [Deltaproteobacteria bacterium]|nr:PAS domain-containing protein [Deltaproteobacteria bacterium]